MGLSGREVFVPQSYELGQEAQVDWFEAMAILGGEARKLQFFAMRSMARAMLSTAPIRIPHSKRCWKPTNMRSPILAVYSRPCVTTT